MPGIRDRIDFKRITAPHPWLPLAVLFGLNAVDELDRSALAVLLPEVRDSFDLSNQAALTLVAILTPGIILFGLPMGYLADRRPRLRLATRGAMVWASFSMLTGLAPVLAVLVVARVGASLGRAVNTPTHTSLIADYYPVDVRARAYATHGAADNVGRFLAPLLAGGLAALVGWRLPFLLFAFPTLWLVFIARRRLTEPVRGGLDRTAAGADEETAATEDEPLGFWAAVKEIVSTKTLRRSYFAIPFIVGALVGMQGLLAIFYEEAFDVGSLGRGVIFGFDEPMAVLGIFLLTPPLQRALSRDPSQASRFLSMGTIVYGALIGVLAVMPVLPAAVAVHFLRSAVGGILLPGVYSIVSLLLPPRVRAMGFSVGLVFGLLGLAILPVVGAMADAGNVRLGIFLLCPMFMIGAFVLYSTAKLIPGDIERVRLATLESAQRKGELEP